jgi:diaminopimelate epimerase
MPKRSPAIVFSKMSGAGNDFIVIDDPSGELDESGSELARSLCPRRTSIGADGLVLVGREGRGDFSVAYFNSDGSRAACGNGYRCAARFAYQNSFAGKTMEFSTDSGMLRAEVSRDAVRVAMPDPTDVKLNQSLTVDDKDIDYHFVSVGVPHVVIEVPDVDQVDVVGVGGSIRRHEAFSPEGANVNFISSAGDGISMRTYERGVEDETLACGTGAVASSAVMVLLGKEESPVQISTRSGSLLVASLEVAGGRPASVWLEGPADLVYIGRIEYWK